MARTRSKPAKATPTETTPEPITCTAKSLPASASNPPKLFVLPKNASQDARIVTLDNPANDTPSRYFFCPERGFYEFTRIAAPKKDCRSWLITSNDGTTQEQEEKRDIDASRIGSGYVAKSADLFIATPIDLLFLILPALAPKSAKDTKQHFLAFDDYLDTLSSSSPHWKALLSQHASLKSMLEKRIRLICDTVDAGDETMYRISLPKLLEVLVAKAERMIQRGLPASLEEKFIKTALEIPIMSIKREESTLSAVSTSNTETGESENTITTTTTTTTTTTQEDTVTPALTTPPEIPHLLRLRTSLTYLTSSYLPPTLTSLLTPLLTPRFTPLTTHLSAIAALKAEAAALRSITDNVSRKRAVLEDDDKMAEREEKKRKKEEEDKKKKMEGRGIKQLKKVDTSGMRKMSSFFTKVDKKK
ncbi:hypothetical protein COCMIDRAFT_3682 [Bipolaris oryzae ATCC 44560]|uniref:Ribonuclease H2 subunit B n=1 Tax=Bipolaris oryzae ATCC 44560 TaxID=930090 RepID=W6ZUI2_COCMI|nr:uncharacterized protein COCMIDRAFT_3682 [Bipolaris oryzae ATCC 44560]EUC47431.1 hypothetical protein COCMIDRAFT_3682 [Bipolaris oryzae ATCC 44560]